MDLGPEDVNEGINSADDIFVPEPETIPPGSKLTGGYEEPPPTKDDKVRSGPPLVGEWQDFFSRIVIRSATNWYIDAAFRGIDEDMLSEREIEHIQMMPEERDRIAKPFAEFANKIKFLRKHGRVIIAGGGISDSVIALGMWMRRVNRIARKYRNRQVNVGTGQSQPPQGNNGFIPGYGQHYYSPGG